MKVERFHLLLISCLIIALLFAVAWPPTRAMGSFEDTCSPDDSNEQYPCTKPGASQYKASPVASFVTGGPDGFGYTWSSTARQYEWKNATLGGVRVLTSRDDAISEPVELPFSFPFYYQAFDRIFIGSNGLIGFDASIGEKRAGATNLRIPMDYAFPQGFLAPFWSDLTGGEVWFKPDAAGSYVIVEWRNVSQYEMPASRMTFEAILYPNGDIVFQYQELANPTEKVTIGIEDMDGLNGLQYVYNAEPGLAGKALLFDRPDPGRRVGISPSYQSNFVIHGEASFPVQIRNEGDLKLDFGEVYNLQVSSSDPDWKVDIYGADGVTPLSNHDTDPLSDTGRLKQGELFAATVKVRSPDNAAQGASTMVTLAAASSDDRSKTATTRLLSSVPVPFAHMYYDGHPTDPLKRGLYIELITPDFRRTTLVNNTFTTGSFSLNSTSQLYFLGLWERIVDSSTLNIEYLMVDGGGNKLSQNPIVFWDNTSDPKKDYKPVSVTAPDGKIGVVWVRSRRNVDQINSNIWFAIRNAENTAFLYGPVNITNDAGWYSTEIHNDPFIAVTKDNIFHLGWVQSRFEGIVKVDDIAHTAIPSSGVWTPWWELFSVQHEDINYWSPALVAYTDGSNNERVLLVYFREDATALPILTYDLLYGVLSNTGSTVQGQSVLFAGIYGTGLDGVQLSGGRLALAWTDQEDHHIYYAILNQDLTTQKSPTALDTPDERDAEKVSVTVDYGGHAILTWVDTISQRLYYALVDNVGDILTSPMILRSAVEGGSIQTRVAFSNAPYLQYLRLFAPLMKAATQ